MNNDQLVKYFRTYHLPWSESVAEDDVVRTSPFKEDDDVVVSLKMDGENFTGHPSGHCHARSLDSGHHESRNYVKALWRSKAHLLPPLWRICGENLYAKHSIHYTNLKSYLYVFSIWTDKNVCLSWDETLLWCELLDLTPVDVIYIGKYDEDRIKQAFAPYKEEHEGYVIRSSGSFLYEESHTNVAKYVRKNHVQTTDHWMFQEIIPNEVGEK